MDRRRASSALLALVVLVAGCATPVPPASTSPPPEPAPRFVNIPSTDPVVARDREFVVVKVGPGDTYATLAKRFLDDAGKAWWLSKFNHDEALQPGALVAVPLQVRNPIGVYANGYQTVTVLCYHRFGARGSRLNVTPAAFEAQMEFLARNGYNVIPVSRLDAFLEGREALPAKTVAITIDDGYKSTFEIAWPILRKYGFAATVYLYTDFVGAGDALTWPQMKEMTSSGLVDIQPHSKTHANLTLRLPGEPEVRYRERIRREVEVPVATLRERLATTSSSYAYPYGDVNDYVIELLAKQKVDHGVTVTPGGNAFYAYPLMLRRSMVFGNEDLDAFKAKLITFVRMGAR